MKLRNHIKFRIADLFYPAALVVGFLLYAFERYTPLLVAFILLLIINGIQTITLRLVTKLSKELKSKLDELQDTVQELLERRNR